MRSKDTLQDFLEDEKETGNTLDMRRRLLVLFDLEDIETALKEALSERKGDKDGC